jgi:thymidine kinase
MCDAVERYHIAKKHCVIVKYSDDKRYDHLAKNGGIVTHAGIEHCKVSVVPAKTLKSVFDEISKYEVIGIDEVQFFDDCVEIIQQLACMGKVLICAGLDGNHQAKPFNRMLELVPLAEDIYKLKAVCMKCFEDASFTMKISHVNNADIKDIGGADKYMAVCRKCRWS